MSAQKKTNTQTNTSTPLTSKDLGLDIVNRGISSVGVAIKIRQLLQNWRQGTVGVKDRSEVSFTNKKPWKQKGTGRARAGSARSPIWRGGGVIFGPQPRVRTLKTSKKLRHGIFNRIVCEYLEQGKVFALPWELNGNVPKTSYAYNLLKNAQLIDNKIVLFVSMQDVLAYASFMNIPNVQVVSFDEANAYDLMCGRNWVILQKDLPLFKEMVSKWL